MQSRWSKLIQILSNMQGNKPDHSSSSTPNAPETEHGPHTQTKSKLQNLPNGYETNFTEAELRDQERIRKIAPLAKTQGSFTYGALLKVRNDSGLEEIVRVKEHEESIIPLLVNLENGEPSKLQFIVRDSVTGEMVFPKFENAISDIEILEEQ